MKFLFVFAHPDDETFSSGGTIPLLIKNGHTVKLVTATKGEAGQLGNPPVTTPNKLGEVREQELRNAAKILGISEIIFLGFIDATLHTKLKELKSKIFPILEKENPDVVITFDKKGVSNHPDHIAVSKVTTELFKDYMKSAGKHVRLYHSTVPQSYLKQYKKPGLEYKAFGEMMGTPDEDITTIVDITKSFETKKKALMCHLTQKKDWERFLKRSDIVDLKKEFFMLIAENSF